MLQTDRFPEDVTIIIEEAVIPAAVFEAAADTGKFSIINSSSSDVAWSEDSSSVPKSCLQSKLSHSKKLSNQHFMRMKKQGQYHISR